jgi:hypothetical protein
LIVRASIEAETGVSVESRARLERHRDHVFAHDRIDVPVPDSKLPGFKAHGSRLLGYWFLVQHRASRFAVRAGVNRNQES